MLACQHVKMVDMVIVIVSMLAFDFHLVQSTAQLKHSWYKHFLLCSGENMVFRRVFADSGNILKTLWVFHTSSGI